MKVWVLKITEEELHDQFDGLGGSVEVEVFRGIFLLKNKKLKTLNKILNSDKFLQINIGGLLDEEKQELIKNGCVRNHDIVYSLYEEEVI